MIDSKYVAVSMAVLIVLAGVAGTMTVATQTTSTVSINASPTDPTDSESTHTVVFQPSTESAVVGSTFNDIRINYSADTPAADVSNVGSGTIERIGIDRGGDNVGTRIDEEANITEVSAKSDGKDLLIKTNQKLNIESGDEIVVVIRPVQNPQTSGDVKTPTVDAVLNTQSTAESASDSVTYEYNDAAVNFTDQSTTGGTVTVDHVNLSEDGYVAVANKSGRNPSAVRGATYLEAGNHTDVTVDIEPPVDSQTELWAQVHMDTNRNQRFDYSSSGGEVDELFENKDGNVMASDSATVSHDESTPTPTPTATSSDSTPTDSTATPTPTPTSSTDDDPDISNFEATADNGTITVTFDSDETLVDIEVDVRGAEDATMHTEDFDGNEFEGYTGTYEAGTDGDYTLELVTAEDSGGDDGADDGDYTDTATVQDGGEETATSTPTEPSSDDPETVTPTDASTDAGTDETATSGADPTESESPTPTATDAPAGGDEVDTDTPSEDDGAGFGAFVALVALLGSALLVYRRR